MWIKYLIKLELIMVEMHHMLIIMIFIGFALWLSLIKLLIIKELLIKRILPINVLIRQGKILTGKS